jgi:hypothetical protein
MKASAKHSASSPATLPTSNPRSESFELDLEMFLVVGYPSFQIGSHAIPIDQSTAKKYKLIVLLRIKGRRDIQLDVCSIEVVRDLMASGSILDSKTPVKSLL